MNADSDESNESLPSIREDLSGLPRAFWVLCGGTFINRFGHFVIPFLALYMKDHGFTYTDAGLAVSAFGLGTLMGSWIGGSLADRFGRTWTIVGGSWAAALLMALFPFVESLASICTLAFLNGASSGTFGPASLAMVTDLIPSERRLRAFAAWRLAINLGFALGSATAGFLAKHSFTWLFLGDACTTAIFGGVAFLALPRTRLTQAKNDRGNVFAGLRIVASDRNFATLFLATLAAAMIFAQFNTTYGMQVIWQGFTTETFGLLLALNGGLIVILELPMTSLTRRGSPRRVIAVGYAMLGFGFALNAAPVGGWTLVAAMAILTLGEIISLPMASTYVASIAPEHMRGRYMGALGLAWSAAWVFGPFAGMYLFEVAPQLPWLACGLLGALAAWLLRGRASDDPSAKESPHKSNATSTAPEAIERSAGRPSVPATPPTGASNVQDIDELDSVPAMTATATVSEASGDT